MFIPSFLLPYNPLPDYKILVTSKLKGVTEDNINVAQMMEFVIYRIENIVGKGENAGYQHFLLFPLCFPKASTTGS